MRAAHSQYSVTGSHNVVSVTRQRAYSLSSIEGSLRALKMKHQTIVVLVVCYSTMTSFAMKSQKYVRMTNSTGAKVCSTDPPSQVLPMFPGGKMQCGFECLRSSACPYYQFKSTTPIQCELYNTFPVNFKNIDNCVGFRPSLAFYPRDCLDISNVVSSVSGVYTVYVGNNYQPLTVYCDMTTASGGWTVFQRRKDGSVDFNTVWVQYAQGFGDVNGEFWIGNDNLNLLTIAKRYKLRVDLGDFNGNTAYAEYDNFVVNSAADKYRLASIGAYSGTAGDSLREASGSQFSTKDQDNDSDPQSCSVNFGGGWWFNNCMSCNMNGIYMSSSHQTAPGVGVLWYGWNGYSQDGSLKTTEMKIKPMN